MLWIGLAQFFLGGALAIHATDQKRALMFRYQALAWCGLVIAALSPITIMSGS